MNLVKLAYVDLALLLVTGVGVLVTSGTIGKIFAYVFLGTALLGLLTLTPLLYRHLSRTLQARN